MAAKLRYPTGVRPLLVEETARRRRVESRFVAALERAGFAEVVLPIIDYADPYAPLADRNSIRQSYRFVDREGDLIAIRSDFTPMLARALAPSMSEEELPLRLFYRGDVIRCDASVEADLAMLRLASELVCAFNGKPTIVYNDVSIAGALGPAARDALVTKRAGADTPPIVRRLIAGEATLEDVAP